jgi:hypothetical protein
MSMNNSSKVYQLHNIKRNGKVSIDGQVVLYPCMLLFLYLPDQCNENRENLSYDADISVEVKEIEVCKILSLVSGK